jgi:integrase
MSVVFNHACRYEFFDFNPIRLVRLGAKRKVSPNVLAPAEIKALLDGLALRERTLVMLAVSTGLRQSELFGLKWSDIDFDLRTMSVSRSVVCSVIGPCKTESSQKPVPLHPVTADTLEQWREKSRYRKPDDWIFASARHRGRTPFRGPAILRKYIQLASKDGSAGTPSVTRIRPFFATLARNSRSCKNRYVTPRYVQRLMCIRRLWRQISEPHRARL